MKKLGVFLTATKALGIHYGTYNMNLLMWRNPDKTRLPDGTVWRVSGMDSRLQPIGLGGSGPRIALDPDQAPIEVLLLRSLPTDCCTIRL